MRVDINERKYSFCSVLEDEYHLVLECLIYSHLGTFYTSIYLEIFWLDQICIYSRLSLSRIPRDSLKYFVLSVPRHIRLAELRKK